MFRGYRVALCAAFGLALIGASPKEDGRNRTQERATQKQIAEKLERIATAIEKPPSAPTPDSGCDSGAEDRQSDLCAQWKAADAAAESARWALLTFVAGLAAIAIGGGTLVAAWLAARWAKKAADHTESGANAAREAVAETREANRITQRLGEAQVRCYLGGVSAKIGYTPDGALVTNCVIKNSGQSPARHVGCEAEITFFLSSTKSFRKSHLIPANTTFRADIAAQSEEEISIGSFKDFSLEAAEIQALDRREKLWISLYVKLQAVDVFGTSIEENERFTGWLDKPPIINAWINLMRGTKAHENPKDTD